MAEIAITGGAGNLGRGLARALRGLGHSIRILDLPRCDFSFFEGWEGTRVLAGDILDPSALREALEGAQWVFHLAAVLPPWSEEDRERTFRVNVGGTRSLVSACASARLAPRVVFASSVSVYGDRSASEDLVGPDTPVDPDDWYAESKARAEELISSSGLPFVNMRISGIAVPAFLDPPEPWPFTPWQKIELVAHSDLVEAMACLDGLEQALGRTLLIAGGPTWQVTGKDYVARWGEAMEIPLEEMRFQQRPGWLHWYDTAESQALLGYQRTNLGLFLEQLRSAVAEALG